jgi:hypothetical protein
MLRYISISFGVATYLLPALWLWQQEHQMRADGVHCGMPFVAAIFWSATSAVVLSGTATSCGVVSWRHLQKPRSWFRTAELAGIALPAIAGLALIGLIFYA